MGEQRGKASQPKRGAQVIDPVLRRPNTTSRPQQRPPRPPRAPAPSTQWPPPMHADQAALPSAKRLRTGDMPPLPGEAAALHPPVPADPELVCMYACQGMHRSLIVPLRASRFPQLHLHQSQGASRSVSRTLELSLMLSMRRPGAVSRQRCTK